MLLELHRHWFTETSTVGELWIGGRWECFTLEDRVQALGVKVPGQTAIPTGRYQVIIDWSERFQRLMPLLLNVPGFTGIRIHSGNTAADTEGCVLVGMKQSDNKVLDSRLAFAGLWPQLVSASKFEKIEILITGDKPPRLPWSNLTPSA